MTSEITGARSGSLPANVLLVEDNPIIAMNTEALLQELGVSEVSTAATASEGLALVEANSFDFAVLDLQLGNENSLPVAAVLAEQGVRFVFATGFGEGVDLPAAYGATTILKKPYRFEDLERVVRGHS